MYCDFNMLYNFDHCNEVVSSDPHLNSLIEIDTLESFRISNSTQDQ